MSSPQLELRAVTKHYDGGRIEALRGVDLAVTAGEFLTISGPSGSGKSTILHLLGGLDTPTTGEVLFQNSSLGSTSDTDHYRSLQVGFIFQAFHLLPTLSAIENVQVPMLGAKVRITTLNAPKPCCAKWAWRTGSIIGPVSFQQENASALQSPGLSPMLPAFSSPTNPLAISIQKTPRAS